MEQLSPRPTRLSPRRAVTLPCVAVEQDRHQLVGQRIRDLSCDGMLVEARDPLRKGQRVMVTFATPGQRAPFMQAMTVVTRVVTGARCWDSGTAVALRFVDLAQRERELLQKQLLGIPPTIPQRALRVESRLSDG
jgi:hypothetical protein